MGTSLDRLRAIAPPPAEPVEAGTPDGWTRVEADLGTPLPDDYKAFTSLYGSGKFDDFLYLFSPFAPADDYGNLLFESVATLAAYAETRARFPDRLPLPPFPEPGGLLPLGRTDNGNELYWVTEGAPAVWPLALFGARATDYEVHTRDVTTFLAGLLAGEVVTELLPEGFLGLPAHTFEPF